MWCESVAENRVRRVLAGLKTLDIDITDCVELVCVHVSPLASHFRVCHSIGLKLDFFSCLRLGGDGLRPVSKIRAL